MSIRPTKSTFEDFLFEDRVKEFRESVLSFAAQRDVPADVAAAALADILGITAGNLDKAGDGYSLDDRLHSFCERVQETYARVRNTKCPTLTR